MFRFCSLSAAGVSSLMRSQPLAIFACLTLAAATSPAQEARPRGAAPLPAPAQGSEEPSLEARPELAAATADAIEQIRSEVLSVSLTPDVTVRRFLDVTGGGEAVHRRVETAQQRGGTRWLGSDTCEGRVELAGGDVA